MVAADVIQLVLCLVKSLCLRDYNFIMPPEKKLMIRTRMSAAKQVKQSNQKKGRKKKKHHKFIPGLATLGVFSRSVFVMLNCAQIYIFELKLFLSLSC